LRIAIVYAGDREVHRPATRENNRFGAVFAAFAARGVEAQPAVYNLAQLKALGAQWQSATLWSGGAALRTILIRVF
jgi:hypothetical protein